MPACTAHDHAKGAGWQARHRARVEERMVEGVNLHGARDWRAAGCRIEGHGDLDGLQPRGEEGELLLRLAAGIAGREGPGGCRAVAPELVAAGHGPAQIGWTN